MFIHKPTNFIRYEEVQYVEFQRYAGNAGSSASRNFDIFVKCKSVGGDVAREFLFSAVDRREFPEISQFLKSKKLKVRNLKDTTATSSAGATKQVLGPEEGEIEDEDEDEDEDSDFGSGEDSEDDSDESLSGDAASEGAEDSGSSSDEEGQSKKRPSKKAKS